MKTAFLIIAVVFSISPCFSQENQQASLSLAEIPPTPQAYLPSLIHGQKLYLENCSSCHGTKGFADTSIAQMLKRKPVAIGSPETLNRISPEKVFETITNGNVDRGMPTFKRLPETDRWDIAAYVFTLNPNFMRPQSECHPSLTWQETRSQSDLQIIEILKKRGVPEGYLQKELSAIRYLPE